MQSAELYRRGIVFPLDDDAERSLRVDNVNTSTRVQVLAVPDELFESLWTLGLFQEINARCGTLIDEFEEEMINASSFESLLAVVDSIAGKINPQESELHEFLTKLQVLIRRASSSSRSILFVL